LPDSINNDFNVNGAAGAAITGDGLLMAFTSKNEAKEEQIWMSSRKSIDEPFGEPVRIPLAGTIVRHPVFSADGLTFLWTVGGDIWSMRRDSRDKPFANPSRLPAPVNTPYWDIAVWTSNDGLVLCTRTQNAKEWIANLWVRPTQDAPFGTPLSVAPWSKDVASNVHISADGERLYMCTKEMGPGKKGIWMVRRALVETKTPPAKVNPPVVVAPTLGEKEAKKLQEDSAAQLKLPVETTNKIGMKLDPDTACG